jgi:hypothetical protein
MNADDDEPPIAVASVPLPEVWENVEAVFTSGGPHLDRYDLATGRTQNKRLAVGVDVHHHRVGLRGHLLGNGNPLPESEQGA